MFHRRQQEIQALRAGGIFEEAKSRLEEARVYSEDLIAYTRSPGGLSQGVRRRRFRSESDATAASIASLV